MIQEQNKMIATIKTMISLGYSDRGISQYLEISVFEVFNVRSANSVSLTKTTE